jgi:hypothetical protein
MNERKKVKIERSIERETKAGIKNVENWGTKYTYEENAICRKAERERQLCTKVSNAKLNPTFPVMSAVRFF